MSILSFYYLKMRIKNIQLLTTQCRMTLLYVMEPIKQKLIQQLNFTKKDSAQEDTWDFISNDDIFLKSRLVAFNLTFASLNKLVVVTIVSLWYEVLAGRDAPVYSLGGELTQTVKLFAQSSNPRN